MPLLPPDQEVHVGDIGTSFESTAKDTDADGVVVIVPITGGTIFWRFHRPDGSTYDRACNIVDGPGGVFEYTSVSGDINQGGDWIREAHITLPGQGAWWANKIPYDVAAPLAVPA